MSASLVGSEMCIRDRCSRLPPRLGHLDSMAVPWKTRCAGKASQGRTVTVSYTHLTLPTICSV
eukprot:11194448-Alexandrium_andersonii.AAC.1